MGRPSGLLVSLVLFLAAPPAASQEAPRPLTREEYLRLDFRPDPGYRWVEHPDAALVAGYYQGPAFGMERLALYPTGLVIGCGGDCAGTWRLEGNLVFLTPTHPGPRNEWYDQFSGPYYVVQFEPFPESGMDAVPGSRDAQRSNRLVLASRVRAYLQSGSGPFSRYEPGDLSGATFVWSDAW